MIETLTPETLCKSANTAMQKLQALVKEAENIKLQFAQEMGLEADSYRNPFRIDCELERLNDNVRRELGKHLLRQFNEMLVPNIPIDPESTLREINAWNERSDACDILRYIQKTYVKDARQKSLDAILRKAWRLLPHAGWKEQITLGQILKKNVLILRKYIRSDTGGRGSFDANDEADSFQKLVRIILEDADPVTVDTGVTPISQIMSERKYDEIPQEISFDKGWIERIRFFKNSKALFTMKGETSAQRIAKVMLDKPKNE